MKCIDELKKKSNVCWLTQALDSKRIDKTKLNLEKDNLQKLYTSYDETISAFNITPVESSYRSIKEDGEKDKSKWSSKKMFMDYYNNPPKKLGELLINRRKEHALTSCPYCGNPVIPTTLDHFMPKDLWAEYSIYPDNLILLCVDCAPIKSVHYYCETSKSCLFIHPFYNDVLFKNMD
ncbi:HNH endonuclease [Pectobacterium brasiliense]|uniref:HNH endonuclease n=1 Tax=Pectobacterium brasiliense TaxID=180957 RepID=UPI0019D3B044|nr:HNH endonuclease [Pectobacterium brasiliense]MBN7766515.1 HNH endonuclease [Pectobacterium brasiliense]MDY4384771.1 HNH endonuclease [Pectobacterium brasiliense]